MQGSRTKQFPRRPVKDYPDFSWPAHDKWCGMIPETTRPVWVPLQLDNPKEERALALPQATTARWASSLPIVRWDAVWREIVRLIKYGLVGSTNTVISLAVLNLFFLLWAPTNQIILVLGSTTAYAAGDLNGYWWNRSWTFGAGKANWGQFARFAAVSLVCMGINAAILWGSAGWLMALFLPSWMVGNASQISMMLSGGIGYLACRFWVFKKEDNPSVTQ